MTVSRGGEPITPIASTPPVASTISESFDCYIVKPGDVITVSNAGEAKDSGVKAGPDVKSRVIDTEGNETNPIASAFSALPVSYTVLENDFYIVVENIRS